MLFKRYIEKTANIDLEGINQEEWSEEVVKYINKNLPHLADKMQHIEFTKLDEEEKDAVGTILCQIGEHTLTIPIIISEGYLKKPDVGLINDVPTPLGEEYLKKVVEDGSFGYIDEKKQPHKGVNYIASIFETVESDSRGMPMNWKYAANMSEKDLNRLKDAVTTMSDVPLPADIVDMVKNACPIDKVYKVKDVIYEEIEDIPFHFKGAMLLENNKGDYYIEHFYKMPAGELRKIEKEAELDDKGRVKYATEEDYKVENAYSYFSNAKAYTEVQIPFKSGLINNGFILPVKNITTGDTAQLGFDLYELYHINDVRGGEEIVRSPKRDEDTPPTFIFEKRVYGVDQRQDTSRFDYDYKENPKLNLRDKVSPEKISSRDIILIYDAANNIGLFPMEVELITQKRKNLDDEPEKAIHVRVLDTNQKVRLVVSPDATKIYHTVSEDTPWSAHTYVIPQGMAIFVLPKNRGRQIPLEEVVLDKVSEKISDFSEEFRMSKIGESYWIDNTNGDTQSDLDKYSALLVTRRYMGHDIDDLEVIKMGGTYKVKPQEKPKPITITQPGGWLKLASYLKKSSNINALIKIAKKSKDIDDEMIKKLAESGNYDIIELLKTASKCHILKEAEVEELIDGVTPLDFLPEQNLYDEEEGKNIIKKAIGLFSELLLLARMSKVEIDEATIENAIDSLTTIYSELSISRM